MPTDPIVNSSASSAVESSSPKYHALQASFLGTDPLTSSKRFLDAKRSPRARGRRSLFEGLG
jgi:hypothetical protein